MRGHIPTPVIPSPGDRDPSPDPFTALIHTLALVVAIPKLAALDADLQLILAKPTASPDPDPEVPPFGCGLQLARAAFVLAAAGLALLLEALTHGR